MRSLQRRRTLDNIMLSLELLSCGSEEFPEQCTDVHQLSGNRQLPDAGSSSPAGRDAIV